MNGESTKEDKTNNKERGYGVHTTHKMIVNENGLGGNFIMLSGNALLKDKEYIDFKCNFQGTLIMFRIPCRDYDPSFNCVEFTE